MSACGVLVAAALVAEVVPLEDAFLGEQLERAIDGGKRNAAIDLVGALVDLLDVGVVLGARQDSGDDAALSGHAQPLLGAQQLDTALVGTYRFCHAAVVAPLSLGAWLYKKAVAARPPLASTAASVGS